MKLIIDRCNDEANIYSFAFGLDFDILLGKWQFPLYQMIGQDTLSEIDKLVTNSINKTFCVLNMRHPLLVDGKVNSQSPVGMVRSYYALRLKHRKYDVELYEFGKRFF